MSDAREATTNTNTHTVAAADLTSGTEFLVPRDLPNDASQYRPLQQGDRHRAWLVKLVADENTDADVDLEAAITTADDTAFAAYSKAGTPDTAVGGTTAPDAVAVVFSNEATFGGINAVLTPATEPTTGEYKVVIEARRY